MMSYTQMCFCFSFSPGDYQYLYVYKPCVPTPLSQLVTRPDYVSLMLFPLLAVEIFLVVGGVPVVAVELYCHKYVLGSYAPNHLNRCN